MQSLSSESPETAESLRRRGLIQEAGKMLQSVSGKRRAYDSREWREAMDMLKEADPDSLALLEDQLRNPDLKPHSALGEINHEGLRQDIVADVIIRRSRLLSSSHHAAEDQPGRLLIYVPSENVADGASRYASNGFYDQYDAPPWDSWIHYSECKLISWVPVVLMPLAQKGIDANPVECIRWAD